MLRAGGCALDRWILARKIFGKRAIVVLTTVAVRRAIATVEASGSMGKAKGLKEHQRNSNHAAAT